MTLQSTPFRRLVATLTLGTLFVLGPAGLTAQRASIPATADDALITHVLNRIAFGPRPGDVEQVKRTGLANFIDAQLNPQRIQDEAMAMRLSAFPTLALSQSELASKFFAPAEELRRQQQRRQDQAAQNQAAQAQSMTGDPTMSSNAPPAPRQNLTPEERAIQQQAQAVNQELMQAKVLRAVMSERQLEEVLVDFWFNHFNVFVGKGQVRQYLASYERDAIRPYVLGNFRDMLGATAHHPAMLFYLDNFQNRTPNPPVMIDPRMEQRINDSRLTPQQRQRLQQQLEQRQNMQRRPQGGLNENYARELLELHTLGVDGGYTQKDVVEVARILTGWTIDRPQMGGSFVFRPQMHDTGVKTVLGKAFQPNGEAEGEALLDMLAAHPSTARHIARKLAQRFISDEPPQAVVDRAAKTFLSTKGDLREVTRAIITSPEFFADDSRRVKVKTPFEYVVSALRATGANVVNAQPVVQALRELGMPLYNCQPPTGYSMTADAWVNTGALLNRMNFALQMVSGGQPQRIGGPGRNGQPAQPQPQVNRPNRQNQPGQFGAQMRPGQQARMPIQIDIRALAADTSEPVRDRLIDALLAGEASAATEQTLSRATTPAQLIALALGSPEFQRR